MIFLRKFYSFIIILIIMNCGYYSVKGSIPNHINTVFISQIINESSEFNVSEQMNEKLLDILINQNMLETISSSDADSRLDIIVEQIVDKPYTYNLNENNIDDYEQVEDWKLSIKIKVTWHDLVKNEVFFEKEIIDWGVYSSSISDIQNDGLDNDDDGYIDFEDDDEIGSARDSAIKIAIKKLSEEIVNEMTATW